TQAQAAAAKAAIEAARADVTGSDSSVKAAAATVQRIDAELDDSQLTAPRDARVQFRLAQPGEVLGAGGKVLNLVDLSDVYMGFFLPETVAG
ncbi:HlyD family efflux transporter periplasmic adaptor subunit, partial [Salmonella enterica]|nr:HlyD family efflux transporter periplasmic adaptor subunit [Salmonella enterica]